jgi:single-strand selective monofunctional uracil DNA glycosylase
MRQDAIKAQLKAASTLRDKLAGMTFAPPASRVYNPLTYAWDAFEEYVTRCGGAPKRVLFLGMNPGPWGMAQTGVPFGEVEAVKNWMGISALVGRPDDEHPAYPVDGFACKRSEVSGRRLWGLFRERFVTAEAFFKEHFVVNYCPLLFIEARVPENNDKTGKERGRNLTPDKLPPRQRVGLYAACDVHLRQVAEALSPLYVVGVGSFAAARAEEALGGSVRVMKILHPSPASPKSNKDWAGEAARQLTTLGIWP